MTNPSEIHPMKDFERISILKIFFKRLTRRHSETMQYYMFFILADRTKAIQKPPTILAYVSSVLDMASSRRGHDERNPARTSTTGGGFDILLFGQRLVYGSQIYASVR